MKYHNWPERGRGSNSYEWNGQTLNMDFDRKFDWENMVDDYFTVEYTDKQANAVAELMSACGIAVAMNYNKLGSGATVTTHIMHNNFKYSPSAVKQRVSSFSDNDIIARVKEEVDANRPMICSGGYHCFVCDGYSGDMLHFNFGWTGWDDGFYDMKTLAPLDNMPVDYIMMGLEPYRADAIYPPLIIQVGQDNYDYINKISKSSGLHVDVSRIERDVPFNAAISFLEITLSYPDVTNYVGEAGIGLFDKNRALKEVAGNTTELYSWLSGYRLTFQNVLFEQSDIAAGDYVAVVGRNKGDSKWVQIPVDRGLNAVVDVMNTGAERIPVSWRLGDRIDITGIRKPAQSSDNSFAWRGMEFIVYFEGADDAVAASVKVNGVSIPVSPNRQNTFNFSIPIPYGDGYDIEINDYRADEMLENYRVSVVTPGTLQATLPVDPVRVKGMALSGIVDARDIYFIRDCMTNLSSLDMSGATIAAYEDYKANILPENSFMRIANLKNIVLPNNIEGLESQAFFGSGIKSIKFPASLHYLQGSCLPELESIYEYALTPPDVYDIWYRPENTTLYVPVGTAELYKAHLSWCNFKEYIELPELGAAGIEDIMIARDENVSIYDLSGIIVYEGLFGDAPQLPVGVYAVRLSSRTMKVYVK